MRLRWLEKWKAVDRKYLAYLRRKRAKVERENIERLIKPEDLMDAFDAISIPVDFTRKAFGSEPEFDETNGGIPLNSNAILALWYQTMLWKLGATIEFAFDPDRNWQTLVTQRRRDSKI